MALVPTAGICRFPSLDCSLVAECSANHFATAGPHPGITVSANSLFIQLIYMS
jgi:hypothetical protein